MKTYLQLFLTIFCCSILSISCEKIEYLSNDRVAFEGYVTRQDGTPLADIPVYTYVYLEGSYGDTDKISYTRTDANGHYLMVFPKPTNHDYINLSINGGEYYYYPYYDTSIPASLTGFSVSNILPDDIESLKIDFGTTLLYSEEDLTSLTINVVTDGTINNGNFLLTAYEGLFPQTCWFYSPLEYVFGPDQLLYTTNWPNNPGLSNFYYVQQEDGITYSRTFTLLKSQNLVFKYRDADNVVNTINIPIANEPVTYTINY